MQLYQEYNPFFLRRSLALCRGFNLCLVLIGVVNREKRVKRTVAYAILGGAVYGGVIAVCVYCGAGGIVKLFSVDSEITSIGKTALQIICFSLVIGGIMPVIQAYFLALGYGKKGLVFVIGKYFCHSLTAFTDSMAARQP